MKSFLTSALLLTLTIATLPAAIAANGVPNKAGKAVQNITSFRAHRQGKDIALSWSAAGLIPARFLVQRSYDGEMFEVLDEVPCAGTATHKFKDILVPPGYLYYRICSMDADGNVLSISQVEVVRVVQRK